MRISTLVYGVLIFTIQTYLAVYLFIKRAYTKHRKQRRGRVPQGIKAPERGWFP